MRKWICVLMFFPLGSKGQVKSGANVIPIGMDAYQKMNSTALANAELPALLGFRKTQQLGIILENKFGLKELSAMRVAYGQPLASGYFLINGQFQGGQIHKHYAGNLGFGKSINPNTTIGIAIGIEQFQLQGDKPELEIVATAGLSHCINEKTTMGIHYTYGQALNKENRVITKKVEALTLGIGYRLSDLVFIQLELQKKQQTQITSTLIWTPFYKIGFFGGTNSSGHFYLGGQTKNKRTTTAVAVAQHPQLGYSILLHFNLLLDVEK